MANNHRTILKDRIFHVKDTDCGYDALKIYE